MSATAIHAMLPIGTADQVPTDDGTSVRRLFPTLDRIHLDPFVVLDDLRVEPPAGLPQHPHRGFEALTYVLEGDAHHRDGLGNECVVCQGGVQRVTAGRGVAPPAMPEAECANRSLSLWVNLPSGLGTIDPDSQHTAASELPVVQVEGARIRTVVGDGSPVSLRTPVRYHDIELEAASQHVPVIPEGWNGVLYVVDGEVAVGDIRLRPGQAAFPPPGDVPMAAVEQSRVIVISGRPHGTRGVQA